MWHFITAIIVAYTFAYPIAQTSILGTFSKVKKTGPQGALQSWFASLGSVARIVIPIASGYVENREASSAFLLMFGLISLCGMGLVFMRSKIDVIAEGAIPKGLSLFEKAAGVLLGLIGVAAVVIVAGLVAQLDDTVS